MRVELKVATDPRRLPHALANFDEVLVDHAHCEKKAAANALSLLQAHPEVPGLLAQLARLARLAREESAHLAKGLQQLIRHGAKERRLDRLLVAGVIEAWTHERLELLADWWRQGRLDPPASPAAE